MSAKQILKLAFVENHVPRHLHGKTQHKTLHARIAEDILIRRTRSRFVRTQPGRFFLRSLIADPAVPEKFKSEFPAPRRAEQLQNFAVLCCSKDAFPTTAGEYLLSYDDGRRRIEAAHAGYDVLGQVINRTDSVHFRVFTVVMKGCNALVSRLNVRSVDSLLGKQSLGLLTFPTDADRTLFATDAFGFAEAALRCVIEQINFPEEKAADDNGLARPVAFIGNIPGHGGAVGAIVSVECNDFDPVERNRFRSNLHWFDVRHMPNDIDDFEPWSRYLIQSGLLKNIAGKACISGEAD